MSKDNRPDDVLIASPLRPAGNGRKCFGVVLRRWNTVTPYVVHTIYHDARLGWCCEDGEYCREIDVAIERYQRRCRRDGISDVIKWLDAR